MEQTGTSDFLTVSEAARRVRVGRGFIRKEIRLGNLPARRLGPKTWRIARADFDAYLAKNGNEKEALPNG